MKTLQISLVYPGQVKDICNDLDVRSLCHKILQNVSILLNADRGSLFLVRGKSTCGSDHTKKWVIFQRYTLQSNPISFPHSVLIQNRQTRMVIYDSKWHHRGPVAILTQWKVFWSRGRGICVTYVQLKLTSPNHGRREPIKPRLNAFILRGRVNSERDLDEPSALVIQHIHHPLMSRPSFRFLLFYDLRNAIIVAWRQECILVSCSTCFTDSS